MFLKAENDKPDMQSGKGPDSHVGREKAAASAGMSTSCVLGHCAALAGENEEEEGCGSLSFFLH